MGNDPHEVGAWLQGRNPHRRKIGLLGWTLLALFMLSLLVLGPR
ncbi:hypothetical protein [Streptomyces sp. NPDC050704]